MTSKPFSSLVTLIKWKVLIWSLTHSRGAAAFHFLQLKNLWDYLTGVLVLKFVIYFLLCHSSNFPLFVNANNINPKLQVANGLISMHNWVIREVMILRLTAEWRPEKSNWHVWIIVIKGGDILGESRDLLAAPLPAPSDSHDAECCSNFPSNCFWNGATVQQ